MTAECHTAHIAIFYIRGPQPPGRKLLWVHGLLGTRPDSRRWAAGEPSKLHLLLPITPRSFALPPELFPPPAPPQGKIVFQETSPWCQKGWGPLHINHLQAHFQCIMFDFCNSFISSYFICFAYIYWNIILSFESYSKKFALYLVLSWFFIFNSKIIHIYCILLTYQLTAHLEIKTGPSPHR